jgi:riboflavin synthase
LVGYTGQHTNLGRLKIGDLVNIEVDILAKYIEKLHNKEKNENLIYMLDQYGYVKER